MKKILSTVAVSTALVMGGAVAASAAGITLDASLQTRGYANKATTTKDAAASTAYDQKATLGFKSKVSDELIGYIKLETGNGHGDTYTWGTPQTAGEHNGGSKSDASDMELVEAWIDYKPGSWGVKVGRQQVALGNGTFYNHKNSGDEAIKLYADLAGTKVQALTVKMRENSTGDASDDIDAYMLQLDRKFSNAFSAGINYTYLRGQSEDDSTTAAVTTAGAVVSASPALQGMSMSNLGINAAFAAGALTLKGDANFQFGTFYDNGVPGAELDANGWMYQLAADYKMGNSKLGLMFGQGSGDDNGADGDLDVFVSFLGDSPYYNIWIPGYRIQTPGSASKNGGLSNLTVLQLNASTSVKCPLTGKPLSLIASANWLQTTEDVAANGVMEDEIGTEVNLVANWKLNNNLKYFVQAAYLFSGDVWNTAGNGNDPDDMYFFRHGIAMKF